MGLGAPQSRHRRRAAVLGRARRPDADRGIAAHARQGPVAGTEVAGTWSSDPLVVAERQRQGLGGSLLRAWDRGTGVALGAALSTATRGRLDEMRWPKAQPLTCLVKPISRRAFRIPTWPVAINRLVSAIALPLVRVVSRTQPLKEEVEVVRRFDAARRSAVGAAGAAFSLAVRRDART